MDNENQWVMALVAMTVPLAIGVAFFVVGWVLSIAMMTGA